MLSDALQRLADLAWPWVLLAAAGIPFFESVPLIDTFAPGEVGMAALGAATIDRRWLLVPTVLLATASCFAGDCAVFWLGSRWSGDLRAHRGRVGRALGPAFDRARPSFERRGPWVVFAARWIGLLRGVIPLVAGASGMPFATFARWAAPAAFAWTSVLVVTASFAGDALAQWLERSSVVLAFVGIPVVIWILVAAFRRRHQPSAADS